jgi:hypothetical protein
MQPLLTSDAHLFSFYILSELLWALALKMKRQVSARHLGAQWCHLSLHKLHHHRRRHHWLYSPYKDLGRRLTRFRSLIKTNGRTPLDEYLHKHIAINFLFIFRNEHVLLVCHFVMTSKGVKAN